MLISTEPQINFVDRTIAEIEEQIAVLSGDLARAEERLAQAEADGVGVIYARTHVRNLSDHIRFWRNAQPRQGQGA